MGGTSKRLFDIVVAGTALVLLTPLFIATGTLIRLVMGKPVFLTEATTGLRGKRFARYRFRMTPAKGAHGSSGRRSNQKSWAELLADGLHASGLDKMPQLFNVIRGDMSLVGPQPLAPEHVRGYCALAPEVLLARPGVTGMWRHPPRHVETYSTSVALDRHYVLHWSMWLDLTIVWGALARLNNEDTDRPAR